jgi:hypothetical protein
MDDERIRQLTQEVLAAVGGADEERSSDASLEVRVAALEAAVRRIESRGPAGPVVQTIVTPAPSAAAMPSRAVAHPSLRLLDVPGGDDRCILEPDKPCEKSGRCRSFGY